MFENSKAIIKEGYMAIFRANNGLFSGEVKFERSEIGETKGINPYYFIINNLRKMNSENDLSGFSDREFVDIFYISIEGNIIVANDITD